MQYAFMKGPQDKMFLMDANELRSFHLALDSKDPANFMKDTAPNEDEMQYRIIYGAYKPQQDFPKSEINRHIKEAVNVWLVHFAEDECVYMGIEDIIVYDEPILTRCDHSSCKKLHKSNDVAFSALVHLPPGINVGSKKSQAVSAFVRYSQQMDAITNLLNRLGVFAFKAEEKRIKHDLTADNWKQYVDHKRAFSAAQSAK